MAPASPSLLLSDSSRLKWKKRKRESNLSNNSSASKKQHNKASHEDYEEEEEVEEEDEDEEEEEEDEDAATAAQAEEDDNNDHHHSNTTTHADTTDLRESDEVLSNGGQRVSDFPSAVLRSVNRPHRSVLGIVAAERCTDGQVGRIAQATATTTTTTTTTMTMMRPCIIENISHGQRQVLSAVLPDHPALNNSVDSEKPPAYVCTPPQLMEGKGVVMQSGDDDRRVLVVPVHSDWFNPETVHRLERQVVPHFFFSSGKSKNHTPDKYVTLRNSVVEKYMENPGKRLTIGDCQGLVSGADPYDLNRIVRFLDHWGIINYLAGLGHPEPPVNSSLIREEANGELQLVTGPLKSIDSLVQFGRPRSSYRPEDVLSLCSPAAGGSGTDFPDLDGRISERLSERSCSYCMSPLPRISYQSQKEADTVLCSHCFHDGKFLVGHSSLDFARADLRKESYDIDGGNGWTDQETFLLLEALEKYHDNWNEIADHVGTKSKAQCFLHFIRLPMEHGLLENLEFPLRTLSDDINGNSKGTPVESPNGPYQDDNSENRLPFSNTANPVMALVAFLATSIGPRIAATCANAALTVLTKGTGKTDLANSDNTCIETDPVADHARSGHTKGNTMENQGLNGKSDSAAGCLSAERVKLAAMSGLSAAATKAKLFADQEEREIQRLTATIINYQLKRLELKLKQFAEIETLLLKECEQVERSRQSILAERARMLSTRLGQVGPGSSAGAAPIATGPSQMAVSLSAAATAAQIVNPNTRQAGMPPSGGQQSLAPMGGTQANLSTVFGNNMPTHAHMPFLPRQPMFPYVGPRLPLSAIHPPTSQAPNVMLPSGMSSGPTNHHALLRTVSSNNNSMGQG